MKPPPFEYHAPSGIDEALELLAALDDAKVLAGGQSLVPLMSLRLARPANLVDVNGIAELAGIEGNGSLRIGAMTRQRAAERSSVVQELCPLLVEALGNVGHPPIRNRGTVGGSCAHADPAAELPAVMTVLGAEFVARSKRGERTIAAPDFFVSLFESSLGPDELLTEVRIPALPRGTGWSFQEVARRHGDFAIVGAAATVGPDNNARIAFSGVGLTPVLVSVDADAPIEEATRDLNPAADIHGSSAYRRHLAGVVAKRAIVQARQRTA